MEINDIVLNKWSKLIEACKNYWIDSIPTGLSDSEFDALEKQALEEDNFSVRDYVFQVYLIGTRTENHYIEKIKKTKVTDMSMYEAIKQSGVKYANIKHDGSSIAIYVDPETGKPLREVTVGNANLNSFGIDQTWKLYRHVPESFPKGIVAIQCEALIDLDRLPQGSNPERARQAVNGLINSKYCEDEVANLLTLRAYRYYTDDSSDGIALGMADYKEVLNSFQTVYAKDGHILFAPADIWTIDELSEEFCQTDHTRTSTGYFLNDGWVLYDEHGICQGALKYSGAGESSDAIIKSTVQEIRWNNQVHKGKDSWSANVIIDPVVIKGSTITKPSAGSVKKLIDKNITPGSQVSIILANSTIPMVGEAFTEGNGDFNWPTCSCGYKMSEKDVYGSLLKCGNPLCTERMDRMRKVLSGYSDIHSELNLNNYLVIDRFKWENTNININTLLGFVENNDEKSYHDYLISFMKTDLQRQNMELVCEASFIVLRECYEGCL